MASLLERVLDVVLRIDKQYSVKYISNAGLNWLGRRPSRITELMHPNDVCNFVQVFGQDRDTFECEVRLLINADSVWVHLKGYHLPEVDHYIVCVYDISEWKNSAEKLLHASYHDSLTGLANRTLLYKALNKRLEDTSKMFALALIDLDGFKRVNDTFGHGVGDEVLINAAKRMQSMVSKNDLVVRLGGDEFVILFSDISDPEAFDKTLFDVLHATAKPYATSAPHEVYITCSIGIALSPKNGIDQFSLLKNADIAMYMSKTSGKNRIQFFESSGTNSYLAIETAMHEGINSGEFFLEYQPQFTAYGVLIGAEALMRWHSDKFGKVPPIKFIPIAEETGLILFLGNWAIRCACHQLRHFIEADPNFIVAVNVSHMQLRTDGFEKLVQSALDESGIQAKNLTLEMTETMLMENQNQTRNLMFSLKGMGVNCAIDDFGTGFSSLSYLTKLPVTTLKIDKSFIQSLFDEVDSTQPLVIAVLKLAHSINLICVAEGVETSQQLEFLKANCCDYIQGYLFARPMSADSLRILLDEKVGSLNEKQKTGEAIGVDEAL